MKRPQAQKDSSRPSKPLLGALGLSLAIHLPVLVGSCEELIHTETCEKYETRETCAYIDREKEKSVLMARPPEKAKLSKELRDALEQGLPIDLGDFYLRSEYADGRIDEDRMKDSMNRLSAVEGDLRGNMEEIGVIKTLRAITESKGEYSRPNSYLSSVLMDNKGNCQARQKYTASLVHRLYPDMKMAYQRVKIDGEMHTLTLVEIDGKWHSMEDPEKTLSEKDIEGTVLYGEYDYIKNYVGLRAEGEYQAPSAQVTAHTKPTYTDNYLNLPLPEGISTDDIKDIISDSPITNTGQQQAAFGSFGSVEEGEGRGNGTWIGNEQVWEPLEVEIITPNAIMANRQKTRAILDHWKWLSTATDDEIKSTMRKVSPIITEGCAQDLIPTIRILTREDVKMCSMDENSGMMSCDVELLSPSIKEELSQVQPPLDTSECFKNSANEHFMTRAMDQGAFEELGIIDL